MSKYIVYDLEMCRVPKGEMRDAFGSGTELIQIGAVMLDESYETVDSFVTFVKPRFGAVDGFIERLTGISQADVESAPSTEEALEAFLEWMPEDAVMVSWSDSDINQIYAELDGKEIDCIDVDRLEDLLYDSIDCQLEFDERIGSQRCYGLANALSITGIDCDVDIHDALVDAKNTALLFKKLKTEKELQMSSYYLTEEDMWAHTVPFRSPIRMARK